MDIFLSKKMRYFMVIMETRNFAKAAETLCITQSPLSKVITELENKMGGKLFSRKHNELSPTSLAWECYHKCKPFYESFISMAGCNNPGIIKKTLSITVDISIPELLFRHIDTIIKMEQLPIKLKRDLVIPGTTSNLKNLHNHGVISFRALEHGLSMNYTVGDVSEIVLLTAENNQSHTDIHRLHVWRDNYTDYFKGAYSALLTDMDIIPSFVEHNYDILTLLYAVRAGKGMAIMPYKMATLYKIDGVNSRVIKGRHIKYHLYHNIENSQLKTLERFRKILSQLI
ncbi:MULTISPECIES: LysR family transcriptional regulator [unclassified Leclercia]|uniref:LysR family transcriptional regulator n=1 Tax=Leclercia barmai TaxID=2785629 RepID=A0ABS7RXE7_9ENTR|nr:MULTISPECIES: LysR family transcriptional regulator [unclassified Leclercia]MBZ0058989.1 LysR family transcriptional regulator [Leclercia sp. EMC7]MCM5697028.1 LysR family transcriptional regulator [Leclercia sp. LTM01]MCM5701144.1 LysR family transcriptional regulator [Leclercia sp. LTM14]